MNESGPGQAFANLRCLELWWEVGLSDSTAYYSTFMRMTSFCLGNGVHSREYIANTKNRAHGRQ